MAGAPETATMEATAQQATPKAVAEAFARMSQRRREVEALGGSYGFTEVPDGTGYQRKRVQTLVNRKGEPDALFGALETAAYALYNEVFPPAETGQPQAA